MAISARLRPGSRVVRRDVYGGAVWSATPQRVIEDGPAGLLVAHWPGVQCLAPSAWVGAQGSSEPRTGALESLAAGSWELAPWVWRHWTMLTAYCSPGGFYSVSRFYSPDGRLDRWYVNFERPAIRHGIFVDTFDLLLDLVATPDLSRWRWKDEDEYAHGSRLGVVTPVERAAVEAARSEVVDLLEQREGLFGAGDEDWAPSAGWEVPALPAGTVHAIGGVVR